MHRQIDGRTVLIYVARPKANPVGAVRPVTVVERWSLVSELSLSYARPASDE